jgi:GTP cyclohydrolase I
MSRITPLQSGKAKPTARLERDREIKAMDAIVTKLTTEAPRPTREEAEQAVRTLLLWAGDDPEREGLLDTPARVAKAYGELFSGYEADIEDVLGRTFEEVGGYDDMVLVRDISFFSHCEHHMLPVIGKAHVAYLPKGRVLGLSKIARVVDVFAKRLQTQENMTAQIAQAIDETLQPRGVAVFLEAEHMCMAMRGIQKTGSTTLTTTFTGAFKDNAAEQAHFMSMVRSR